MTVHGEDIAGTISHYKSTFSDIFPPAELDIHIHNQLNSAKKTFDPSKGASFNTHLSNHMKKLTGIAHEYGSTLKSGRDTGMSIHNINRVKDELYMLTGSNPSPKDISRKVGIPVHLVEKHMKIGETKLVGVDDFSSSKSYVDIQSVLPDMNRQEKKIADTITMGMPTSKALSHTGMTRASFFRNKNKLRSRIRKAYLASPNIGLS